MQMIDCAAEVFVVVVWRKMSDHLLFSNVLFLSSYQAVFYTPPVVPYNLVSFPYSVSHRPMMLPLVSVVVRQTVLHEIARMVLAEKCQQHQQQQQYQVGLLAVSFRVVLPEGLKMAYRLSSVRFDVQFVHPVFLV